MSAELTLESLAQTHFPNPLFTAGNAFDLTYNFVDANSHNNGNVIGITNNLTGNRSEQFTYDQVNRILTAQTVPACTTGCRSQAFTYDQWGNLTAATATGSAPPLALNVGTNNQVTSANGVTFNFDGVGNELNDVTSAYAWNAESQIKTANSINYTYDGEGNRVQKSNGKIYWYGAGSEILDESDSSGNFTEEYVFFGGKRIAHKTISSGSVYYYAEDMLGSSRVMATSAGAVCYDADFYPFGGEDAFINTCPQNYKFTGKERDAETTNDDFGARYYSSTYGRFLSADWSATPEPVPYANPTNPQTLNLYAMARDNPETFADLDGHCIEDLCIGEAIAVTALASATISYVNSPQGKENLRNVLTGIAAAISSITDRRGSSGEPGAGKRFSPKQRAEDAGKPCEYCGQATTEERGKPNSRETDHIDPKSKDGNNTDGNKGNSCRTCNRRKGPRTPEEWKGKPLPPKPQPGPSAPQSPAPPAPAPIPPKLGPLLLP